MAPFQGERPTRSSPMRRRAAVRLVSLGIARPIAGDVREYHAGPGHALLQGAASRSHEGLGQTARFGPPGTVGSRSVSHPAPDGELVHVRRPMGSNFSSRSTAKSGLLFEGCGVIPAAGCKIGT